MQRYLSILILVLVAVTAAHEHHHQHHKEEHAYPKYVFEYGVHDPHTHDAKKQWEERDGDVVKGSYRVIQPDGRIRIVNYYADGKNGFNAEVKYIGKAHHPSVHKAHASVSGTGSGSKAFFKGFAKGFSKGFEANGEGQLWKGKASSSSSGPASQHQVPLTQTIGYTIDHSSGRSKTSALGMGYSVGVAGGLDTSVHGFDTREPHAYKVNENYRR